MDVFSQNANQLRNSFAPVQEPPNTVAKANTNQNPRIETSA
jgi:hypothetical protein